MLKLLPVLLVILAAASWFAFVQEGGPYLVGNLVPLLVLLLLALLTLYRGGGKWSGTGMCMPLGTLGFAVPALGLSLYLHFAYSVNLNDLFSESRFPERVFRYLPVYTLVAGGIGFAIGWIVGRNV
ncbi:MAG: hypothetical protein OEM50_02655 [Gammaproteobacteria bacterium]|nr:hypothetical protein [Gammaproteobacteria bacterium]MDH3480588.1 hypothetical protein [Gammaproteobacteria bacterium]